MKGLQLFDKHTSKRDYTGGEQDEYAQTLFTIFTHIGNEIYPLLEKAEKQNKKLRVNYPNGILLDEIDMTMIEIY